MDLQLDGKRAVVTGSSAGIGEAIARRLAAEGAAVTVHGRRADAVGAVVEAIRSLGGRASSVVWGPLGAGILSGKYARPAALSGQRRLADVDPGRLAIAQAVTDVADSLGLTSSLVALAWLRSRDGVIPILGARTAQQLADNLACLDVTLPAEALARLDQASHVARGFPHDFLATADYTLGGMSARLDMPPGRARYG